MMAHYKSSRSPSIRFVRVHQSGHSGAMLVAVPIGLPGVMDGGFTNDFKQATHFSKQKEIFHLRKIEILIKTQIRKRTQ